MYKRQALSRGAESAIAVDYRTGKLIRENAEHCRVLDRIQIIPDVYKRQLYRWI